MCSFGNTSSLFLFLYHRSMAINKHEANQHFNHQKQQGIPEPTADDPSAPNRQLSSERQANTDRK